MSVRNVNIHVRKPTALVGLGIADNVHSLDLAKVGQALSQLLGLHIAAQPADVQPPLAFLGRGGVDLLLLLLFLLLFLLLILLAASPIFLQLLTLPISQGASGKLLLRRSVCRQRARLAGHVDGRSLWKKRKKKITEKNHTNSKLSFQTVKLDSNNSISFRISTSFFHVLKTVAQRRTKFFFQKTFTAEEWI